MQVRATTAPPAETGADTICVGVFEGEAPAVDAPDGALAALVACGEARPALRKLGLAHSGGRRWMTVGLGDRDAFDAERARVAGAVALQRARELGSSSLCWAAPEGTGASVAAGLVQGSVLGGYRFDRYRAADSDDPTGPDELIVSAATDLTDVVATATVVGEAQNAARDLQNAPANDLTPTALAQRARALAGELEGLSVDVEGREGIAALGMGAFAAVARGSDEEPALIVLHYTGPDAVGPRLGFVGKAVTFDTGGISIKPSAHMQEMKFDMSGGAAVLEAVGAIARLGLPVNLIAVIGATENMPSGRAVKPGDIVRALNGTTIEVNNTDAEGRLVLADCLTHAVALGAERLVDLATLTGAIITALGSTHAGLFGADDEWCATVQRAARESGEEVWRMPLHPEYAEMIKGRFADVVNSTEARKASSITAAEFLRRFTADVPWVHLDIAGTAWDTDRAYAAKGGSGFGVRLLVELARQG